MNAVTTADTRLTRQDSSDMLIEYAAERLASFVRPYQLRRELEELIYTLTGEQIKLVEDSFDELIRKAQQFNAQQAGERPQKVAINQICFLQNAISNDSFDMRTKLVANAQLSDLVGTRSKDRSELLETGDVAELVRRMVSEMDELVEMEDDSYA